MTSIGLSRWDAIDQCTLHRSDFNSKTGLHPPWKQFLTSESKPLFSCWRSPAKLLHAASCHRFSSVITTGFMGQAFVREPWNSCLLPLRGVGFLHDPAAWLANYQAWVISILQSSLCYVFLLHVAGGDDGQPWRKTARWWASRAANSW